MVRAVKSRLADVSLCAGEIEELPGAQDPSLKYKGEIFQSDSRFRMGVACEEVVPIRSGYAPPQK